MMKTSLIYYWRPRFRPIPIGFCSMAIMVNNNGSNQNVYIWWFSWSSLKGSKPVNFVAQIRAVFRLWYTSIISNRFKIQNNQRMRWRVLFWIKFLVNVKSTYQAIFNNYTNERGIYSSHSLKKKTILLKNVFLIDHY